MSDSGSDSASASSPPPQPKSKALSPNAKLAIGVTVFVVVVGVAAFVYEHWFNKAPPDTWLAFLTNPQEATVNGGDAIPWQGALNLDQAIQGQKTAGNGRVAQEEEVRGLAALGHSLCAEGWVSVGASDGAATKAALGKICGGTASFGLPPAGTSNPLAGTWAAFQAPSSDAVKTIVYNVGLATKGVWSAPALITAK